MYNISHNMVLHFVYYNTWYITYIRDRFDIKLNDYVT